MFYGYNDTSDEPRTDLDTDPMVVIAGMRKVGADIRDDETEELLNSYAPTLYWI